MILEAEGESYWRYNFHSFKDHSFEREEPASLLVTRPGGGGSGRQGSCDMSHDSGSAERRNGTPSLVRNCGRSGWREFML